MASRRKLFTLPIAMGRSRLARHRDASATKGSLIAHSVGIGAQSFPVECELRFDWGGLDAVPTSANGVSDGWRKERADRTAAEQPP